MIKDKENIENEILKKINDNKLDNEVLEFIYQKIRYKVYDFVRKNSGTFQDGEDIFQDSIVEFWFAQKNKKFGHFKDISTLLFLIIRIARANWLDTLRKKKRERELSNYEKFIEETVSEYLFEEDKMLSIIKRAINLLSPQCKSVLDGLGNEHFFKIDFGRNYFEENLGISKSKGYRCIDELKSIIIKLNEE